MLYQKKYFRYDFHIHMFLIFQNQTLIIQNLSCLFLENLFGYNLCNKHLQFRFITRLFFGYFNYKIVKTCYVNLNSSHTNNQVDQINWRNISQNMLIFYFIPYFLIKLFITQLSRL